MEDRIWVAIHPDRFGTRLIATEAGGGVLLKARLAPNPWHQRALPSLLEALAFWQKQPVHAVLAVDGEAGTFASNLLPDLAVTHARNPLYSLDLVEGRRRARRAADRVDGMGSFRDLRHLMVLSVAR